MNNIGQIKRLQVIKTSASGVGRCEIQCNGLELTIRCFDEYEDKSPISEHLFEWVVSFSFFDELTTCAQNSKYFDTICEVKNSERLDWIRANTGRDDTSNLREFEVFLNKVGKVRVFCRNLRDVLEEKTL
jgi:hypothetical protein